MKKILLLLIIPVITWSCEETEPKNTGAINACGVSSPLSLPWVYTLTSGEGACVVYKYAKLYMYDFNGEKVFYFENLPSSLGVCNQAVYDCSGKVLFYRWNEESWANFLAMRKNEHLLWERK